MGCVFKSLFSSALRFTKTIYIYIEKRSPALGAERVALSVSVGGGSSVPPRFLSSLQLCRVCACMWWGIVPARPLPADAVACCLPCRVVMTEGRFCCRRFWVDLHGAGVLCSVGPPYSYMINPVILIASSVGYCFAYPATPAVACLLMLQNAPRGGCIASSCGFWATKKSRHSQNKRRIGAFSE